MKALGLVAVIGAIAVGYYYVSSLSQPSTKSALMACAADVEPEAQIAWLTGVNGTLMKFPAGENVIKANAARPAFTGTGWLAYIKSAQDAGYVDDAGITSSNIRLTGLSVKDAPVIKSAPEASLAKGPWIASERVMLSAERQGRALPPVSLDLDLVFGCTSEAGAQPFAIQQVIGKAATH